MISETVVEAATELALEVSTVCAKEVAAKAEAARKILTNMVMRMVGDGREETGNVNCKLMLQYCVEERYSGNVGRKRRWAVGGSKDKWRKEQDRVCSSDDQGTSQRKTERSMRDIVGTRGRGDFHTFGTWTWPGLGTDLEDGYRLLQ